jgi:hypothetical protein
LERINNRKLLGARKVAGYYINMQSKFISQMLVMSNGI